MALQADSSASWRNFGQSLQRLKHSTAELNWDQIQVAEQTFLGRKLTIRTQFLFVLWNAYIGERYRWFYVDVNLLELIVGFAVLLGADPSIFVINTVVPYSDFA